MKFRTYIVTFLVLMFSVTSVQASGKCYMYAGDGNILVSGNTQGRESGYLLIPKTIGSVIELEFKYSFPERSGKTTQFLGKQGLSIGRYSQDLVSRYGPTFSVILVVTKKEGFFILTVKDLPGGVSCRSELKS